MNKRQTSVALRMLRDPRLPLEHSDIFTEDIQQSGSRAILEISEEKLGMLFQFVPELVYEYRNAGKKRNEISADPLRVAGEL